jgi:hypothetical protein
MRKKKGQVLIPANANVWKHELTTAQALALNGHTVTFLTTEQGTSKKSPDIVMMGQKWEIKSPRTDKLSGIERNLKKATKQSGNIIIDSHRLSSMHDVTLQRFLIKMFKQQKTITRLILINKKRQVIDIGALLE